MNVLQRFWHRLWRRDHEPRLWPVALVNYDTREVRYELGTYSYVLKRTCTR